MKLYIQLAEKHLQAAADKKWDYPTGSVISTKEELLRLLKDGKTVQDVWLVAIARYGTITGGVMNSFLGHASASTRAALRKGLKTLIGNI